MNWKAHVACDFNCLIETKRLVKVEDRNVELIGFCF